MHLTLCNDALGCYAYTDWLRDQGREQEADFLMEVLIQGESGYSDHPSYRMADEYGNAHRGGNHYATSQGNGWGNGEHSHGSYGSGSGWGNGNNQDRGGGHGDGGDHDYSTWHGDGNGNGWMYEQDYQ